jgi:outer membrane lipoprotein SlyB
VDRSSNEGVERAHERRSRAVRVAVSVLAALVGGAVLLALADANGPARVSEVAGSVVTPEVIASSESKPRYYVHVRIDGGKTVRATAERDVTAMPGDRVVLQQTESALLGLRRYRYERHVGPWPRE